MTLKEYTEKALRFAEDTKEWGGLDDSSFYTTGQWDEWEETSDNAHGGIDLSWAFHENQKFIKENAAEYFIKNLLEMVRLAVDDEWDHEQIENIIEDFS